MTDLALVPVTFNQCDEPFHSLFFGNVLQHTFLATIERDATATGTHIPIVGIGHLARSVDDTAHDAYLQSLIVGSGRLDAGYRCAEVIERAAATGT